MLLIECVLQLENGYLLILLADADVLLKRGHTQVGTAANAVLIGQDDAAQGVVGGLLNDHVVDADALGVVIVEEDILAVDGLVDICLNAVVRAVAGGNESGIGVFFFKSAASAVSDEQTIFLGYFDGVHGYALLKVKIWSVRGDHFPQLCSV